MKKSRDPISGVNYLYFLVFLLVLLFLTFSHFLRASEPHWGTHLFFLIYALGQALLEVLCFMLLGLALHRRAPLWTYKAYAGLLFAFLLAHFANFTMIRLLDVSLSYFFKFFFGCGIDHFRVAFQAMNMNSTMVGLIIGSILFVPIAGVVLYWITHKVSLKKPLHLTLNQTLGCAGGIALLLLLLDIVAKPYLTCDVHNKYSKTLPLGLTFLSPTPHCIPLPSTILPPREEKEISLYLREHSFALKKKPNIYLFVIETLRKDFIDKTIAPNIHRFQSQAICPAVTYSNANSTHLSWFSIFHSIFPFQWTYARDYWKQGSAPLQILKKLGYRIHVYASADLSYFNMDQVIFGKNRRLADSIKEYSSLRIEPCERDALAMKELLNDMEHESEGTIFLVFLDSTHSEYSSPASFQPFQPAAASIDYLAISSSTRDLELLKNRYRNAIHWIDHLLGHFFDHLEERNQFESSIIALTGDHGEEFFEEGALFHGTHLNHWQTSVPLVYKFPDHLPKQIPSLSTHLDIFPTLLHVLTGQSEWATLMDGQSLFLNNRWPYALSVQHNGTDVPYEFSLSNGQSRLQARFLNPPLIHTIPGIELIALETPKGREQILQDDCIGTYFPEALSPLLMREMPR